MRIRLHSIKLCMYVHASLLFLVRPLQTLLTGRSNLIDQLDYGLYVSVWLFSLVALAIFLVSIGPVRFAAPPADRETGRVKPIRFFAAFLVWLLVWVVLLRSRFASGDLMALLDSSSDYIHGKSIFLLNTATMLLGFFIVKSYALRLRPFMSGVVRWVLVLLGVAAGVVSGSKTLALYPFFIIMLHRSMARDGFSAFRVGVVLLISLPIMSALNVVRHSGVTSVAEAIITPEFFSEILPAVVERYYGTDVIYEIVRHHTVLNKAYFYGESLLQMIYAFIPSSLWADKPIISFGKIISDEYLPSNFRGLGISAAPTIIGELFANFSWACLIILPFFGFAFGRHLRVAAKNICVSQKHYLEYYLLSFTTLGFVLEVSIVGWIVQLMALYLGTFGLNMLVTMTPRHVFKELGESSVRAPDAVGGELSTENRPEVV